MDSARLRATIDWLMDGARPARLPTELLSHTCERLVAAGLPLWRVGVFVQTLHPDVYGFGFVWRRGAQVVVNTAGFDLPESPEFIRSPLRLLFNSGNEVRYRLDDPESRAFAFFDDMRGEGVTDYIALPLSFTDGSMHACSWTTKDPTGFSDAHLAALRDVVRPVARLAEILHFAVPRPPSSTLTAATAPVSASWPGKSAAATPKPCRRRSGFRICAVSPRCQTGLRRRSSSTFSTSTSIVRCRRSANMAAKY